LTAKGLGTAKTIAAPIGIGSFGTD